jgi:hypothetical protein
MLEITNPSLTVTQVDQTCEGLCPSCGQYASFDYLGEQHWPMRVAEALGCSPVNHLWTCRDCQTTISEVDIRP